MRYRRSSRVLACHLSSSRLHEGLPLQLTPFPPDVHRLSDLQLVVDEEIIGAPEGYLSLQRGATV